MAGTTRLKPRLGHQPDPAAGDLGDGPGRAAPDPQRVLPQSWRAAARAIVTKGSPDQGLRPHPRAMPRGS